MKQGYKNIFCLHCSLTMNLHYDISTEYVNILEDLAHKYTSSTVSNDKEVIGEQ